jgi:hypothetical protein
MVVVVGTGAVVVVAEEGVVVFSGGNIAGR